MTAPPAAPVLDPRSDNQRGAVRSLVFRVSGRVYACEVDAVREVVPRTLVTPIPAAPGAIVGLVNVRGAVVTVVDGGVVLHGTPAEPTGAILVVDLGPRGVGLAVDRVADVRGIREDEEYTRLDVRALAARFVTITEDR